MLWRGDVVGSGERLWRRTGKTLSLSCRPFHSAHTGCSSGGPVFPTPKPRFETTLLSARKCEQLLDSINMSPTIRCGEQGHPTEHTEELSAKAGPARFIK